MRTLIVALLSALGGAEQVPTVQQPEAAAPVAPAPVEPAAVTTQDPTPEPEDEPAPTPARTLTTAFRGNGVYQWATGLRFDTDFRWRGGISLFAEGQRDFFDTEIVDPGQDVARVGAALRLGNATVGFKANYFPGHQPFAEQLRHGTLVDVVGRYDLPLDKLDLKLRAFGGINAEWADRWNGLAFAGAHRAFTLDELSPKAPDIGTLNVLTIATGPAGGDRYKPSVLALALYDMPRGLRFGLSGFYAGYAYHTRVGEGTPWGRIGFSKAYEVTGFKKGVWTRHILLLGWAHAIKKAERGRLTELYVGAQYTWGLDDGFHGDAGSARDAIPTGYDGGAGDLAFMLWWIELRFDVGRRTDGAKR